MVWPQIIDRVIDAPIIYGLAQPHLFMRQTLIDVPIIIGTLISGWRVNWSDYARLGTNIKLQRGVQSSPGFITSRISRYSSGSSTRDPPEAIQVKMLADLLYTVYNQQIIRKLKVQFCLLDWTGRILFGRELRKFLLNEFFWIIESN